MKTRTNDLRPTIRCAKRPRTVLPARGLAGLRRVIASQGLTGELCSEAEHYAGGDSQQQAAYAWQDQDVLDMLDEPDEQRLTEHGARSLLETLRARHLPHWTELRLQVLEQGEDVSEQSDLAGSFRQRGEERYIVLWKLGDHAQWGVDTVLHEFAHAMVFGTYGGNFQGVEPHGAEFVGVLCYLLSEHHDIDVGDLLLSAVGADLRVLPFDPREWTSHDRQLRRRR